MRSSVDARPITSGHSHNATQSLTPHYTTTPPTPPHTRLPQRCPIALRPTPAALQVARIPPHQPQLPYTDSPAAPVPQRMAPSSGGTAGGVHRARASAAGIEEESWCSRRSSEPLISSTRQGQGEGGGTKRASQQEVQLNGERLQLSRPFQIFTVRTFPACSEWE